MAKYEVLGKAGFRFNSRFGQLIGRNLISNPIVAVSELVKNCYDADADNISVAFSNLKSGISSLKIIDDGDGMSYADLTDKWMMVGTDNKLREKFTAKGRRKLGEKGIGRFSVERLSEKLTIKTSQAGDDFALSISIDWNQYEKTEKEFSEIEHEILKIPCDIEYKGTVLTLEILRDIWDEDKLIDLRKELNLIRPIDINKVSYKKYTFPGDKVKIKLIAPDFKTKSGMVDSAFMKFSQAHLFGEITADRTANIRVSIKSNISMSKEEINEIFNYTAHEIDMRCGPLTYEIFVFFKDKRLYKSLDIDRKLVNDLLENYSGVKIYRDGFRILPFGDLDNDWLELNAKRTASPEHRIASTNAIGIVYITRDSNPGLQDVLSRENMYDTAEFKSLKNFVNIAFEKYTSLQLNARKKRQKKHIEEGKAVLDQAEKSVNSFSKQVGSLQKRLTEVSEENDPVQQVQKIALIGNDLTALMSTAKTSLSTVKYAYTYYKKQDDFKSREMQIYRNIATLGISAAMFGHEAIKQTVDAKVHCDEFKCGFPEIAKDLDRLQNLFNKLYNDICLIDEKADFFRNYLRREKQDRARYVDLKSSIEAVIRQHKKALGAINVNPNIQYHISDENLKTWGYEGDFDTVFTNLITNAYKALKTYSGEKFLNFDFYFENDTIVVITNNNGKPIEMKDRPHIFDPLFSTYSDGTGLGLTIIQDTLSGYQGAIELSPDYPITKFKITIPRQMEPKEE